jgi:hypothetical protein
MRRALILISASLLMLSACTTTKTGTPSPSGSTNDNTLSPNSPSGVPGPGVPKVDNPIDTTRFKHAPCDTLTAEQINILLGTGITPKPDLKAEGGPTCRWNTPEVSQASVSVTYMTANTAGLTAIYQKKGNAFPFFQPMESINDYPTVAYGLVDERKNGRCAIALGTSDTEAVDVAIAQSEENIGKKDPCAAAHDVAANVLGNLRAVK